MAERHYQPGDKVQWASHGSNTHGVVVETITEDGERARRQVRASQDEPQYLVRSAKSGAEAVHKPGALKPYDK